MYTPNLNEWAAFMHQPISGVPQCRQSCCVELSSEIVLLVDEKHFGNIYNSVYSWIDSEKWLFELSVTAFVHSGPREPRSTVGFFKID